MDLDYGDTASAFRDEVRLFLDANRSSFPTTSYDTAEGFDQHRRWDRVLYDAGLSVITWPQRYGGRDASLLHWLVFEEELFCSNCGTEAPRRDESPPQDRATVAKHSFVCDGCGASMSYDASVQTLRCPFCGSEKLTQTRGLDASLSTLVSVTRKP